MITQQSQVKINLPIQLKSSLRLRAGRFGMPMAGYIKYLILKDVSQNDFPTFDASAKTEKAYEQSQKEESDGKLARVDDLNNFFENM